MAFLFFLIFNKSILKPGFFVVNSKVWSFAFGVLSGRAKGPKMAVMAAAKIINIPKTESLFLLSLCQAILLNDFDLVIFFLSLIILSSFPFEICN